MSETVCSRCAGHGKIGPGFPGPVTDDAAEQEWASELDEAAECSLCGGTGYTIPNEVA